GRGLFQTRTFTAIRKRKTSTKAVARGVATLLDGRDAPRAPTDSRTTRAAATMIRPSSRLFPAVRIGLGDQAVVSMAHITNQPPIVTAGSRRYAAVTAGAG